MLAMHCLLLALPLHLISSWNPWWPVTEPQVSTEQFEHFCNREFRFQTQVCGSKLLKTTIATLCVMISKSMCDFILKSFTCCWQWEVVAFRLICFRMGVRFPSSKGFNNFSLEFSKHQRDSRGLYLSPLNSMESSHWVHHGRIRHSLCAALRVVV